ncbi:MAG: radical SAM protein [Rhodocyclaceae bacterium]
MTYVYPVVSRRARGVSVGINLNPNNACNWRCIYCQVANLKRGGPPPIDLGLLETELRTLLNALFRGDYLERYAPPEARRVVDVAFSGNGEPTSAREFPAAVALVGRVLDDFALPQPVRLITNGSLLRRSSVREGIRMIGQRQGEVWFKIDGVGAETTHLINGVVLQPALVLDRLKVCATLCPTWVQSCFFMLDGKPPSEDALEHYLALLGSAREAVAGVHLYGLARPSQQPEAPRLKALPAKWFDAFAERIREATGLTVDVSP